MRNKTRNENNTQLNNFSTQIFLKVPFCRIVIMRALKPVMQMQARKRKTAKHTETETNMNVLRNVVIFTSSKIKIKEEKQKSIQGVMKTNKKSQTNLNKSQQQKQQQQLQQQQQQKQQQINKQTNKNQDDIFSRNQCQQSACKGLDPGERNEARERIRQRQNRRGQDSCRVLNCKTELFIRFYT